MSKWVTVVLRPFGFGAVLSLTMLFASPASATLFSFDNITNNNAVDAAIGEAQLFVDVTAVGATQILFTFLNIGPLASSIADVYFDNGNPAINLLSLAGLIDADDGTGGDSGVDFSPGASPPDLPGGNAVGFETTTGFLTDSDAPAQPNGVNPGESLGIIFNLIAGQTFNSVLAALGSGDLRIGLHVQGFRGGGSESFVNNGVVPEPATIGLIAAGMMAMASRRKRLFS